jgi:hypothetical protein
MDCGSLLPLFLFQAPISGFANPKQARIALFRINDLRNANFVSSLFLHSCKLVGGGGHSHQLGTYWRLDCCSSGSLRYFYHENLFGVEADVHGKGMEKETVPGEGMHVKRCPARARTKK